jgi:hypothetical protein
MAEENKNNSGEMDFEQMMEERMQANFSGANKVSADASNERLKEMNKKLPSWSLEPPYSFIR